MVTQRLNVLLLVLLGRISLDNCHGFTIFPSTIQPSIHRRMTITSLGVESPSALGSTKNEFSRPLNTDRILKTSSGKQRRAYRDYQTTIEATPEECLALAERFELKTLRSLKAELSLTPPPHYNSQGGGYLTVQVEGSILASLIQTCVRTNEEFEVTVEFPLSAIVRPVSMNFRFEDKRNEPEPEKKKNKSKKSDRIRQVNDISDLQQRIQQQVDEYDFGTDDMVEDESIYSLSSGMLDVGELVAQTFWLNLDPYPKKPGSGPMEFTISGWIAKPLKTSLQVDQTSRVLLKIRSVDGWSIKLL